MTYTVVIEACGNIYRHSAPSHFAAFIGAAKKARAAGDVWSVPVYHESGARLHDRNSPYEVLFATSVSNQWTDGETSIKNGGGVGSCGGDR